MPLTPAIDTAACAPRSVSPDRTQLLAVMLTPVASPVLVPIVTTLFGYATIALGAEAVPPLLRFNELLLDVLEDAVLRALWLST